MTISNNPAHRSLASLNLPLKVPALLTYALNIVKALTGNPHFPSPTPTLAVLTAAIAALSSAETATLTRVKGSISSRNTARVTLVTLLQQLKGCVQTTADADPENSSTIIESAGISVPANQYLPLACEHAFGGGRAGGVPLTAA